MAVWGCRIGHRSHGQDCRGGVASWPWRCATAVVITRPGPAILAPPCDFTPNALSTSPGRVPLSLARLDHAPLDQPGVLQVASPRASVTSMHSTVWVEGFTVSATL
eukprot:7207004-Pyramimonas_sp.AAC.1